MANGNHVAIPSIRPDREANAKLIAAAPDLLEAAQKALVFMETNGHRSYCGMLSAAIAKAIA